MEFLSFYSSYLAYSRFDIVIILLKNNFLYAKRFKKLNNCISKFLNEREETQTKFNERVFLATKMPS